MLRLERETAPTSCVTTESWPAIQPAAAGAAGGIGGGSLILALAHSLISHPAGPEVLAPICSLRERQNLWDRLTNFLERGSFECLVAYLLGVLTGPLIDSLSLLRLFLRRARQWLEGPVPVRRTIA